MNIEEMRVVVEPTKALENIPLDKNNPERYTTVGANMEKKEAGPCPVLKEEH